MKTPLLWLSCILLVFGGYAQPKLFGLSAQGGSDNVGSAFCVVPSYSATPTTATLKKQFLADGLLPNNEALVMLNGIMYGVTQTGGINNTGTIFSYNPATKVYKKSYDFYAARGEQPYGGLVVYNGRLYGTTSAGGANGLGVIYSFDPQNNVATKLYDFNGTNGSSPYSTLTLANGRFYGTTVSGGSFSVGVIYSFNAAAPEPDVTVEYNFGVLNPLNLGTGDATLPYGNLILASDGKLYGMSKGGGANGMGAIYSVDLSGASSAYSLLASFDGANGSSPQGALYELNGLLYGMTNAGGLYNGGTLFAFNTSTSTISNLRDLGSGGEGLQPNGALTSLNGILYGLTSGGGSNSNGTMFSFDPANNSFVVLKSFGQNYTEGQFPYGSLFINQGVLYGLTSDGGISFGTMFQYDLTSNAFLKLYNFGSYENSTYGDLVQLGSKFYGLTSYGGINGYGTIFSLDAVSGAYNKLFDFDYTRGANPFGGLVAASNGKLYGMTYFGGSITDGAGVIFCYDPATNNVTVLKNFTFDASLQAYPNGSFPAGSLVEGTPGMLYGMTSAGGDADKGVLFSISTSGASFNKLFSFSGLNGSNPTGSLVMANGSLWGTTTTGSTNDNGVVFSFTPSTSTYNFKTIDGAAEGRAPRSTLALLNGQLYGTTSEGGTNNLGTLFSFNPSTGINFSFVRPFNALDGSKPSGRLLAAADGRIYGLTSSDGSLGGGTVFSVLPAGNVFTKVLDLDRSFAYAPSFNNALTEYVVATPCTVTQVTLPTINPVCEGNSFTLTASAGAASYSWTGPGGFTATGQTITRTLATVAYGGAYKVTATYTGSCPGTTSATTSVVINTKPLITAGNISLMSSCSGISADLSAYITVTGTPTPTVTYKFGSCAISSSPIYTFPVGNTSVEISASNGCGGTISKTITVTVTKISCPSSANKKINTLGCFYTIYKTEFDITGTGLSYKITNGSIITTGSSSLASVKLKPGTNSIVWYSGTKVLCSFSVYVTSPSYSVTLTDAKCMNSNSVSKNCVYLGYSPASSIKLTAVVSSTSGAPYTYRWYKSATPSTASFITSTTVPYLTVTPQVNTTYSVVVTDAFGCSSATAQKTITAIDTRCGHNMDKVVVCQVPSGNPGNEHTICIAASAVPAHLAKGCYLGPCSGSNSGGSGCGSWYSRQTMVEVIPYSVTVAPNPSTRSFNITVKGETDQPSTLRVIDEVGRVVETLNNVKPGNTITIGDKYNKGVYILEAIHATGRNQLKIIKTQN